MGAWKSWEIGMIEDGRREREIIAAEARIKGTLADPLVRRLLAQDGDQHGHRDQVGMLEDIEQIVAATGRDRANPTDEPTWDRH